MCDVSPYGAIHLVEFSAMRQSGVSQ